MPARSRPLTLGAAVAIALVTLLLGSAAGPAAAAGGSPVGGPELGSARAVWHVPAGVPEPPVAPARAYLVADLTSGQILVARNVHARLLTASTMKVLTALTLLPRLSPTQVYRARAADQDVDGSKVGIAAGSTYTVHQLFLGMMLSSGNDAANALANAAGGVPATVALMQQEAISLGALDTTVRDPSGLDAPGQRSSAYDLAVIARAAMQRADFRTLVTTRTAEFPGKVVKGKRGKGFQIQNHNELLTGYRGAIGVKTGYTEHAKWTYIGAARRGTHTYLVTEMGLSRKGFVPAEKLLDWAFAHGAAATPVGHLVAPGELAAAGSTAARAVPGQPAAGTVAATSAAGATSRTARLAGIAGLVCAGLIVGGLGLGAARRGRT